MKIYSDFDRDISFANYKTYGWLSKETHEIKDNPLYYSELSDKVIKREVGLQLKNKGYTFSSLDPDLQMNYHIITEGWTTAISPDPFGYRYDSYWINREIRLSEYREGTLIIDLMDPKTNSLVWRGWVVNYKGQKKPYQVERQIEKATQKIFEKFRVAK